MGHAEGFLKLVELALKNVKEISAAEVQRKQSEGAPFHFVDCREGEEWRQDHAAGAVHIGKGVIERDIETKIPNKNEEVIIYCGGGFRSALAAEAIQKMGYKNVWSMAGGIREWKAKELPLEK